MHVAPVVGKRAESKNRGEHQKEKPNHLIPQGMKGLYDSRHHVLQELTAVPDRLFLPHDFIVTKLLEDLVQYPANRPAWFGHPQQRRESRRNIVHHDRARIGSRFNPRSEE